MAGRECQTVERYGCWSMKACLLYRQEEWKNTGRYYDYKSIVQDLGLNAVFMAAAKEIVLEEGKVKLIQDADTAIVEAMRQVMMVPLLTAEEIRYRQEVLRDCLRDEALICEVYELSAEILQKWDKLGRRANAKGKDPGFAGGLVTEIHVLQLFVDGLGRLRKILDAHELHSEGLAALRERLGEEFPAELEQNLRRILADVGFYANEKEHNNSISDKLVNKPRIVMGCSLGENLKLSGFRLEEVATEMKKHRDPNGTLERMQDYWSYLTADSVSVQKDIALSRDGDYMEQQVVQYVLSCCMPFETAFNAFFDQLHFQAAFYRGAVTLRHYMERFKLHSCFPSVGAKDELKFTELQELVMAIEQRISPVGNTCDIENKMLLIVTGANQGGKSTFLRSIGIAQIMLQCGLQVAAEEYRSGIYPSFFTHFTRREDSEMNSGRLDEELSRMSQIVDNLGEDSLILLNESFASTTEKEGSVIAYDIVRALNEAGVKILTVTHLLSFAQRMYEEAERDKGVGAAFFCAERQENGRRTFKMIQHAPELTSFGLDLYDEIIGKK